MLDAKEIIAKLHRDHTASGAELLELLRSENNDTMEALRQAAQETAQETFGKAV